MSFENHNVKLNGELQFKENVSKEEATALKDKLLKEGVKEVSTIRFEGRVKYIYTYRNVSFYKNLYVEDDD